MNDTMLISHYLSLVAHFFLSPFSILFSFDIIPIPSHIPLNTIIAYISWDPQREAFTIPYLDLSIMWYGILFASGFVAGYFIFVPMLQHVILENRAIYKLDKIPFPEANIKARQLSLAYTDKLVWFVVIGTIIGARLGHVFFYEWPYYQAHPMEILMIRNGGLASHGGTVGVLIALYLFFRTMGQRYANITFLGLLDLIAAPVAFTSGCIRLGNFVNQEIVGTATNMQWGIIFGHPAEGGEVIPRHPAQLYEAIAYFATCALLYALWRKYGANLKPGVLCGLFFVLIFGSRFMIEFVKLPQGPHDNGLLQIGQYLSLPFILLGIILMALPTKRVRTN